MIISKLANWRRFELCKTRFFLRKRPQQGKSQNELLVLLKNHSAPSATTWCFYKVPEALVFYGEDANTPIGHRSILNVLHRAFKAIGITASIRKSRNITFHSWRHFFNSFCGTKVPDSILQRVTGHRDNWELYTMQARGFLRGANNPRIYFHRIGNDLYCGVSCNTLEFL